MKPSQADTYWSGYRAASAGRKRSAPSALNFEMMHWWLGGLVGIATGKLKT